MTFEQLRQFIAEDMRMSQVYQPVMLTELLRRGGSASVSDIAQAILDRDPTQIEYFTEIVKNMVGSVLTKRRGITEKNGEKYILKGADQLTPDQVDELVALCKKRIDQFEVARGGKVWAHRRRGHRPVPGSVRYKVLSAAKFRCELCGVSADEKNLEVDHIFPKSLGGRDDITTTRRFAIHATPPSEILMTQIFETSNTCSKRMRMVAYFATYKAKTENG